MKSHLTRRIPIVVAAALALAVLAFAFPASANPGAPNPGHAWTEVENHGIDAAGWWLGAGADQALELRLNGQRVLRLEPNATSPNVIGGYSGNSVTAGVYGATISGGGFGGGPLTVTGDFGTIGGGQRNTASGGSSTVGGGWSNTASEQGATVGGGASNTASGDNATVGGGYGNTASGQGATVGGGGSNIAGGNGATVGGGDSNIAGGNGATVGGGSDNIASSGNATVGGGYDNEASGWYATVPGGVDNTASGFAAVVPGGHYNAAQGNDSFAAGQRAKANNQGCFVWGDSNDADVACNDNDRFIARASGGVYLYTNSALTSGAFLAAGSGSWSTLSARDLKENFTPADGQEVLARVAEIPMSTWNYKAQDASIRHMGPMAQDFYAAFGLGENNTSISTVDADGVALASIQGLYELVQQKDADIAALKVRVDALEQAGGGSAVTSQASSSGPPTRWLLAGVLALGALALVQRQLVAGRRQKS